MIHQIENQTYEKTVTNQTNFAKTLPGPIQKQAKLAVKDEYTFDFLELGEDHAEMELERALMSKINRFLVEMGGALAFLGDQYRLEIDGQGIFHRHSALSPPFEVSGRGGVKRGNSSPSSLVNAVLSGALDDLVREKGENPSIGIILCKDKDKTIVEYALRETKKPIGVAKYKVVSGPRLI